jgi:hypothetical protein
LKLDEVQRRVPVLAQELVPQLVREQVSQLVLVLVLEQLLASAQLHRSTKWQLVAG